MGLMCHPEAGGKAFQGVGYSSGSHWTSQFLSFIQQTFIKNHCWDPTPGSWPEQLYFQPYGEITVRGKTGEQAVKI